MKLLCISLWQPWASLLFAPIEDPVKKHETRGWRPIQKAIGRRIGIHAAKKLIKPDDLTPEVAVICERVFGADWPSTLPRGAMVGTVVLQGYQQVQMPAELMGAHPDDVACGNWDIGRFVWRMTEPRRLPNWEVTGRQGFFEIDLAVDTL